MTDSRVTPAPTPTAPRRPVAPARPVAAPAPAGRRRRDWATAHRRRLLAGDALGALVAGAVTAGVHAGGPAVPLPDAVLAAGLAPLWVALVGSRGAYGRARLGSRPGGCRAVRHASVLALALGAGAAHLAGHHLGRGFVLVALPLVTASSLLGRWRAGRCLDRRRARGEALDDVLVVGSPDRADRLAGHLRRTPAAGYRVVGALAPGDIAAPDDIGARAAGAGVAAVVVADAATLAPGDLRRLAWVLAGHDIDVVAAPGLTDVAGSRVTLGTHGGVPLLHVGRTVLTGRARRLTELAGRLAAVLGLLALGPVLLGVAIAVRLTSPGPALFRQRRIGRHGEPFTLYKFRTMHRAAEDDLELLVDLNEHDGVLFKLRDDPRVTRLGRVLRRFSVDELPQLWNVVQGHMSLVGPRPALPGEVARYEGDLHRRLLVKPGLTGLWQVSGRSDLPWDESVRLDLYYVENWSVTLDLEILVRTVASVLVGRGAY